MKAVFFIENDNLNKAKDVAAEEPIVRQSITFRDNKSLGLETEGNFLLVDGTEDACNEAKEKLKEIAQELEGDE